MCEQSRPSRPPATRQMLRRPWGENAWRAIALIVSRRGGSREVAGFGGGGGCGMLSLCPRCSRRQFGAYTNTPALRPRHTHTHTKKHIQLFDDGPTTSSGPQLKVWLEAVGSLRVGIRAITPPLARAFGGRPSVASHVSFTHGVGRGLLAPVCWCGLLFQVRGVVGAGSALRSAFFGFLHRAALFT